MLTPKGGTEILRDNLIKYVGSHNLQGINLIISQTNIQNLHPTLPNILWQHLNTDEENTFGLKNTEFVEQIDKFVFVSDWQSNKFRSVYNLPAEKCITIRNAIEDISFQPRINTGKVKLIYTSTPWRGLDILIDALKIMNRSDIELDVYSSTVIYGVNFMKNKFDWLFDKCRKTKGVNYKGYVTNKAVRLAVQKANIFSYPSIFEETSCLAAIEAGMAGCKLVLTDFGALPETCGQWASYIKHSTSREELVNRYSEILNIEIEKYWNNHHNLLEQAENFRQNYTWEVRKQEWITLIQGVKQ